MYINYDLNSLLGNKYFVDGLKIIAAFIFTLLLVKISNKLIDKLMLKRRNPDTSSEHFQKIQTLGHLIKSIATYGAYTIGVLYVLTIMFGPVPLTFAGIGGMALGLASQNLIKDVINGFFILFENQFALGDCISVGEKKGMVESFDLRTTKIRGFGGELYIFPNSTIATVTNHSRGPQTFSVLINIDYKEDIKKVKDLLTAVCMDMKDERIIDAPSVLGITEFSDRGIAVKIAGKSKPLCQFQIENKIREEIKAIFDRNKIKFAYYFMKK